MSELLDIYDFDGTLFKSPEPSEAIWGRRLCGQLKNSPKQNGLGWYHHTASLEPPFVPADPPASWFVTQVFQAALESSHHPNQHAVLLTGRSTAHADRVRHICKAVGLEMAEYHLKPPDFVGGTLTFKRAVIRQLVDTYRPSKVRLWEDRPLHAEKFVQFLSGLQATGKVPEVEVQEVRGGPYLMPEAQERELVRVLNTACGSPLPESRLVMHAHVVAVTAPDGAAIPLDRLLSWLKVNTSCPVVEANRAGTRVSIVLESHHDAVEVRRVLHRALLPTILPGVPLLCGHVHPLAPAAHRRGPLWPLMVLGSVLLVGLLAIMLQNCNCGATQPTDARV
eukprot:GGOE01041708.1.p1 GENE.GGOE01041708.1~~GGOE01041708.1.p1  ORF type:complete len:351 (+),score=59.15 GGOE01041708.1:45-1055(+)